MVKNLVYLLVFAFVFTFVSCDKGDGDSDVSINTISAKWEILDSDSPYASFEFNKDGNYIIVENIEANLRHLGTSSNKNRSLRTPITRLSESESTSPKVHFGTYRIEENKIILLGIGLIEVVSVTDEEFSFSFTIEATGQKNAFVAGKSNETISPSSRTNMLCRTWIIEEMTADYEGQNFEGFIGSIVLFSRAGTYLISYPNGKTDLSEWKWGNDQETQFYYSWEKWTDDWYNFVAIITDLKETSLTIEEQGIISRLRLKQ
jgi:hypothetical protein